MSVKVVCIKSVKVVCVYWLLSKHVAHGSSILYIDFKNVFSCLLVK